ncbi:MAG: outer membrane beta-barrel protein [Prolixibacteraceae bacterium]|nr:outer membrane beta-barrel protein [Prolixibacteraceae bacterium]
MKLKLLCLLFFAFALNTYSQNETKFEPSGNPTLRIFGNFHTGLTPADNNRLFEIERAFLGYQYQMSPNWMAEVKIDIGSPENESVYALVKRYAYFRNAYVRYKKEKFSIDMGIVGMTHFKVQESFWGNRYFMKSFADEYKFGKSVDMGIVANYQFNKQLSIDLSVVNGEGYSQLQADNYFEYTLGTTIKIPKNLTTRLYVNFGPSNQKTKMVYAAFVGYQITSNLSIGAEYNLLTNYKYLDGRNQTGYSVYSTYKIDSNWKVYGRYDILESNILTDASTPWNLSADGSAAIAGVERKVNSNLKFSLNYRDWYPIAANMTNKAYIYLNMEFKL